MARTKKAVNNAETVAKNAGYEEIGGGDIIKWSKGTVIKGEVLNIRSLGKNKGNLLDIRLEDGDRSTYGCPTILFNRLNQMDNEGIGANVIIECLGKIDTDNGPAWNFRLWAKEKGKK